MFKFEIKFFKDRKLLTEFTAETTRDHIAGFARRFADKFGYKVIYKYHDGVYRMQGTASPEGAV